MADPIIKLKKSSVKDKAPTTLAEGELAVNFNEDSPALYIEDSAGNVIKLADGGAAADGKVATVTGTAPIAVNNTDPLNPVIEFDDAPDGSLDGSVQYARQVVTTGTGTVQTKAWAEVDIPPGTVTSDTPPVSPEAGQLWWNSGDDSGRLYVYYEDANSSQWVEASPQGDVDGLFLSKTSNDTAAGAITFKEKTTHENGVKVTGGAVDTNSIISNGEDLVFYGANSDKAAFEAGYPSSDTRYGITASTLSGDTKDVEYQVYNVKPVTAPATYQHIYSVSINDVPGSIASFKAFNVDGSQRGNLNATNNYGYFSNVNTSANPGSSAYSFYASGNAPNYFAGILRTGNVTNPGGTGGDGNAESDDGNRYWATQSSASNGVRVGASALQCSYYATNSTGATIYCNRLGTSNGNLITFMQDGVIIDSIKLDGSGGIAYGVSDYRLKENIVDLPSATDAIKSLHPVNYNFKTHPGKTRPGFIAHELADVLPSAVTGEKDATEAIGTLADYDGTELETAVVQPSAEELEYTEEVEGPNGRSVAITRTRTWTATGTQPVYQGVDQTKLIPLLTKALQEVLTKNEDLEARIAALEGA